MSFLTDFTISDPNAGRLGILEQVFTSSGTWTAPAGVNAAQVILVGGGGGGGQSSGNAAGGGGGGGAVVTRNLAVTPGTTYNVTVGAGGQGGAGQLTSWQDYNQTFPGVNGGSSIFGTGSVLNLLQNTTFDFSIAGWENLAYIRQGIGAVSQSTVNIYPNVTGLQVGMYITGPNVPGSTTVTAINTTTNQVTLSQNITSSTSLGTYYFNWAESWVYQGTINYPAISSNTAFNNNLQTANKPATPDWKNLSNNLWFWNNSTMEDPNIINNGWVRNRISGTLSITNTNVPPKLQEMQFSFTKSGAVVTNGSAVVTGLDTTQLMPGMYVTLQSAFPANTQINTIDVNSTSGQITLSNVAYATNASATLTFSYGPYSVLNQNCLVFQTGSTVPNMLTVSAFNNGTTSNGGSVAIAVIPGQTYTMSAYIAVNTNISTSTPILFQLRSTGYSNYADVNTTFLGGTSSSNGGSIDASAANGFFVRQQTPTVVTGYGTNVVQTATFASAATTLTLPSVAGILVNMTVTGTGITAGTTVTAVNTSTNVVTLSTGTASAQSGVNITFAMPANTQLLATGNTAPTYTYQRVYATFTIPAVAATRSAGVYAWGDNPIWVYPQLVFQQPNVTVYMSDFQLEVGSNVTAFIPPTTNYRTVVRLLPRTANVGNLEMTHRFTKVVAGTAYSGSAFLVGGGSSTGMRPINAFIEWFDAQYNSLGRVVGSNQFVAHTGVGSYAQDWGFQYLAHPLRIAIENQVAPVGTAYARFGFQVINGATSTTANQVEYYMFAPQFEAGTTITNFHDPLNPNDTAVWSGMPGMYPITSTPLAIAGGGVGCGAFNSPTGIWVYGLPGANQGGQAGQYWSTSSGKDNPNYAGGGAGAGGWGYNGAWNIMQSHNGSTTQYPNSTIQWGNQFMPAGQHKSGNYGGYGVAFWGTNDAYLNAQGGDGGPGIALTGAGGTSITGIMFGGGGGGGGWGNTAIHLPGKGNAGGGRGGVTYLYQPYNSSDYHSRGMDAQPNTGSGGGGGGNISTNEWDSLQQHSSYYWLSNETNAEIEKWINQYNTQINDVGGSLYSNNAFRMTAESQGNGKMVTAFPIAVLPRTELVFPGMSAILRNAPGGVNAQSYTATVTAASATGGVVTYTAANNFSVGSTVTITGLSTAAFNLTSVTIASATSTQFTVVNAATGTAVTGATATATVIGQTKKARFSVRWLDASQNLIFEDRMSDIIFTSVGAWTYNTGQAQTIGTNAYWQTRKAPDNAVWCQYSWEFANFDAGDYMDVDFSNTGIQYYAWRGEGGNGADGIAIVRWYQKASF